MTDTSPQVVQLDITVKLSDGREWSVLMMGTKDDVTYSTSSIGAPDATAYALSDAIRAAAAPFFAELRKVPVPMATLEGMPWVATCATCAAMQADQEPGLMTWLQWVARHFRDEHAIALVGA